MSTVLICPTCNTRWKIIDSTDTREVMVLCPVCPPPGQLVALTFADVCPEPKDAA